MAQLRIENSVQPKELERQTSRRPSPTEQTHPAKLVPGRRWGKNLLSVISSSTCLLLLTMVFFSQKKLKTKYLKLATFQNFALRWIMSFLTLTKFEDKYLVKKRKTNLPFLLVLMWQLRFLNLLESRQDWGSLTQGGWWYVHCIRIWGLALKENRHNFHLCLKELYLY